MSGTIANSAVPGPDVEITPISHEDAMPAAFAATANAFGHQARDGIWMVRNPGWDTPSGQASNAALLAARWRSRTRDRNGDPNTVFLAATVPDDTATESGRRVIAGFAIWVQLSMVPGHGDKPVELRDDAPDLVTLFPDDEATRRFCAQTDRSLHARRIEVVKEKAATAGDGSPPAVFVLDICAVDPRFQRRGIAAKLVQWGLDEARRRGGLEALTEASSMGRHVYAKLGFQQEGGEMEFHVDEEFRGRDFPSNIFMRTGKMG